MIKKLFKKYGWKPYFPDIRDFKYKLKPHLKELPEQVDLSQFCSRIESQGELGSCTSQSITSALELLDNKDDNNYVNLSRLFLYFNEREMNGEIEEDSGAYIRDGIKSLAKQGICNEDLWEYDIDRFREKPPQICYDEALKKTITSYERLNSLYDMKNCLASGFPFVFGFSVYENFESEEVYKTGIVNLPSKKESLLGGHAVLACSYNNMTQRFKICNSYGEDWGEKGFFYLPYEYLENRDLSDDFWVVYQLPSP